MSFVLVYLWLATISMPNVTKEITTTTTQKMIFAFKSHQSGVAQTTEHIFSKIFLINFFRAKVNLLFSGPRSKLLSEGTLSVSNICSRKSGPGRPLNASNSSQNCPLWVVRNNRTRFNKPVSPCLSSYKEILSWVVVL